MRPYITITLHKYILAGIALLALVFMAGTVYGGYALYKRVLVSEASQRAIIAEQSAEQKRREEVSGKLITLQQEELTQTKTELEKSKQVAAKTQSELQNLSKAVEVQSKVQKDTVITSNDLSPYVTGIVQVICSTDTNISSGSGSLFTFKEVTRAVLTNYHVVKGANKCVIVMTDAANTTTGIFALESAIYSYNKNTDEAVMSIGAPLSKTSVPAANYNYSLADLKRCSSLMPVGTPVVIIGFPAYAKRDTTITIDTLGTIYSIFRTTTNGIISGYDTSTPGDANYFVSAKIDNGNSGGMALAKDEHGLCALGLPTWLTVGKYETQGLVQNITNVLPPK